MARSASDDTALAAVRARVPGYFPELAPPLRVRVEGSSGNGSRVYRVAVEGRDRATRAVVVKIGTPSVDAARRQLPQLGSPDDVLERDTYEYRALTMAHERFTLLGRQALWSVRPLDHLPELQTIVMEHAAEPTLRTLLAWRPHGRRERQSLVTAAMSNLGAWLREYHALAPVDAPLAERASSAGLAALAAELASAIGDARRRHTDLDDAATILTERLARLPAELPTGLGHGDLAPRNVFVRGAGEVAAFDMLGKWRVPVYEDIAYLFTSIRMSRTQLVSGGRALRSAAIDEAERAFLAGYSPGAGERPLGLLVYEVVALLDRWLPYAAAGSGRRSVRGALAWAVDEAFGHELKRLVTKIERS